MFEQLGNDSVFTPEQVLEKNSVAGHGNTLLIASGILWRKTAVFRLLPAFPQQNSSIECCPSIRQFQWVPEGICSRLCRSAWRTETQAAELIQ